jgi:hypothetical protein
MFDTMKHNDPQAPEGSNSDPLDFSNLLVPTLDSTRGQFVVGRFHNNKRPVLLVGSSGTAKTSTINMFFQTVRLWLYLFYLFFLLLY